MWFELLTGFLEESPQQVRDNISVDGTQMTSNINGAAFICGELETPTLSELRKRVDLCCSLSGRISVREVVANVQQLHTDEDNSGALFQVASQFNLLEMVSPHVTPEHGVGIYEHDPTQGPACAIAAGAGTIYRNYFVTVDGEIGQTADNQIDCLADIGAALGNSNGELWEMTNGYAMPSEASLKQISTRLQTATESELDRLRQLLRIGTQWNTQVTLSGSRHLVSQAYCSALPVAYSHLSKILWADFAILVLEASYEATLCAAIINARRSGNNKVFLTLLGGGAFGNENAWIFRAIERALEQYREYSLDVKIVSYGGSNPYVQKLLT